jgi:hypothetical protein
MHIIKGNHKLFIFTFIISLIFVGCDNSNTANTESYEAAAIIEIKDDETEKEIIKQVNNYISNGSGFAYCDNEWIYFSRIKAFNFGDALAIGELYKMKEDATEITKLSNDAASNIFVKDDWIYYINDSDFRTLYKIRTDGTDREKINDEHRMFKFTYLDNWIYFNEYLHKKGQGIDYYGSPGSYLASAFSRMSITGSDYQRILDIEISNFTYSDEYIYARDESFDFIYAGGGILRIKRDDLCKDDLESNTVECEVVMNTPLSGTYFTTPDNRIIHSLSGLYTEDGKRYMVEDDIENAKRKLLIEVGFNNFNIKNGWIYGMEYYYEENEDDNIQILRLDKNKKEVIVEIKGDSNTSFNIVGDWILYNSCETMYALSLDGKESKVLVESYSTIGDEDKYNAMEAINQIEEIIEYFEQKGYLDGEYLNFMNVKSLENKYPIANFGVPSEDRKFYNLNDLFNMTADDISNANIVIQEIYKLKFRLEYYKSLV